MKKLLFVALLASLFGTGAAMAESDDKEKDNNNESRDGKPNPAWETANRQAQQFGSGKFSTCTDNPFLLCSRPQPHHKDPMRSCWDELCK